MLSGLFDKVFSFSRKNARREEICATKLRKGQIINIMLDKST